jgi:HlyD family secretion protein
MKKPIIWTIGILAVAVAGWAFMFRGKDAAGEIEFRYAEVEEGTLIRSIEAVGQLVAKTTVDVKSKAGGRIVQLAVEEGSIVKKGDLIAIIDPADTQAVYEQAAADVTSAEARAAQAKVNYELQVANSRTAVQEARQALEQAKIRAERTRLQATRQPQLTSSNVRTAEANYKAALAEQERLNQVTIPQMLRDTESDVNRTRAELTAAEADMQRQEDLLQKGYVAQSAVDQARSRLASARAAFSTAEQRRATIEREITVLRNTTAQEVERAQASLAQAKANSSEVGVAESNLKEAQQTVRQAELALEQAVDAQRQVDIRRQEVRAAEASTVRSKVSLDNAKVQLESTTVVAPRDGVVTLKYLEEGTIIPPGTSTFSEGTSLVQISDTTEMYVECTVDEADIGAVKPGQDVLISTEAFPGEKFDGKVERINPSATTQNDVTAVLVRVRVLPGVKLDVRPGMNATCEFITLRLEDVVLAPGQAVESDGDGSYVLVKNTDPKLPPERRPVEVGEEGNDGIEIKSGLKPGEEVVTGQIDLAEMRDIQRRMQESKEGGGLAGGTGPRRR